MGVNWQIRGPLFIVTAVILLLLILVVVISFFNLEAEPEKPDPRAPLVLVWELVGPAIDYSSIESLGPVQVVSPTWFHLEDGRGNMRNDFDPAYLKWAKERDYQVWALVTNSFDPKITKELLIDQSNRRAFAEKLVALAVDYELDGLNIDFENFHYTYRIHFKRFVSELAELCRAEGLILSVDVTLPSSSDYWSLGYDRAALAEAADYLILMAYDEHYQTSPVAGPVASLAWVERGLQNVLNEVPPDKIILGVPFYTRLWVIDESPTGPVVINSWTYSMHRATEIIAENEAIVYFDDQVGQNVAEFERDGHTYKMWLEDNFSMRRRLELINKYGLAGVAGWRRGLEKPGIWKLMETYFGNQ